MLHHVRQLGVQRLATVICSAITVPERMLWTMLGSCFANWEDKVPVFRQGLHTIEARRLVGTAVETMDVIDWVRNTGEFYWLLGNANEPATLVPEGGGGKAGDSGIYLDPANGELVIHTQVHDVRAGYGDWIIFDDGVFSTSTAADFQATYDPA